MPISRIHTFLVHPARGVEVQPDIRGTQIPRQGALYRMLNSVYDRAPVECDIEIVFQHDGDGAQKNECRDLLTTYVEAPTLPNGRLIAKRLQKVTTHRSGLGLFFLMKGESGQKQNLLISRFPGDQGVVAQERAESLSVEFIERVFMKNAKAYKSALYSSDSSRGGFWDGRAVDRQISGPRELSEYWIREFLLSELRTTGPAGTKRLAVALREAIRSAPALELRQELISAASLPRGQHGKRRSVRQIVKHLGLSPEASQAIEAAFPRRELMDELFEFDRDEFQKHATYRAVELDNGGMLVAEDDKFAEVFRRQDVAGQDGRVRYLTEGRIVDERLRKMK